MRVAVLCSGTVLQPALEALFSQNLLVGLGVPDRMPEIHMGLEHAARQANIPFVRVGASDIEAQLGEWLGASKPDVVCVMGCPYKIPESVLDVPRLGFFNLHGGALPSYRGPDPVFWQIRNGESLGAITIHRISAELDRGGIARAEAVPIGAEDTYGLYMQRLGAVLPRLLIEFVQQLAVHGNDLPLAAQETAQARYWDRPSQKDLTVDWTGSAASIKALVRACNPLYGGALTAIRGVPIRLLQVSEGVSYDPKGSSPGLVLQASPDEGILVSCGSGQTLFLDIICAEDGFFTGKQMVRIFGVRAGDALSSF